MGKNRFGMDEMYTESSKGTKLIYGVLDFLATIPRYLGVNWGYSSKGNDLLDERNSRKSDLEK